MPVERGIGEGYVLLLVPDPSDDLARRTKGHAATHVPRQRQDVETLRELRQPIRHRDAQGRQLRDQLEDQIVQGRGHWNHVSRVRLTTCRSAANAKVIFERTTAATRPERPGRGRAWRSTAAIACWAAYQLGAPPLPDQPPVAKHLDDLSFVEVGWGRVVEARVAEAGADQLRGHCPDILIRADEQHAPLRAELLQEDRYRQPSARYLDLKWDPDLQTEALGDPDPSFESA